MTVEKEKISKDDKYNKKRQPLFRVEITAADTASEVKKMEKMKEDILAKSGTAKRGVVDMYDFAKKNGYFG
jgi:hypothetical protein